MNSSTEPGWIEQGRAGTRDEREPSIVGIRVRLLALAVKLVWNRDDAEEIVQETFRLGLQKMIATHDPKSMPWMMRTVGNLALNLRRRIRPQALAEHVEGDPQDSLGRLAQAERLELLRSRMLLLPDQQRLALTLRMLEQREYAEIAEVMQISVSAVRTHVHLARQTLMRDLKEDEP